MTYTAPTTSPIYHPADDYNPRALAYAWARWVGLRGTTRQIDRILKARGPDTDTNRRLFCRQYYRMLSDRGPAALASVADYHGA